jgi:hypothetical protein
MASTTRSTLSVGTYVPAKTRAPSRWARKARRMARISLQLVVPGFALEIPRQRHGAKNGIRHAVQQCLLVEKMPIKRWRLNLQCGGESPHRARGVNPDDGTSWRFCRCLMARSGRSHRNTHWRPCARTALMTVREARSVDDRSGRSSWLYRGPAEMIRAQAAPAP